MRLNLRLPYRRADIERLISGGRPRDERLARLLPYTHLLRQAGQQTPPDDEVDRFAALAARLATTTSAQASGARVMRPSRPRSSIRLRPRLAGAFVALAVLLSASAGVAYAADSAVPGDTLYDLDRALEDFGIGDGGLSERLEESDHLVQTGRFAEGLSSAATAIAMDSNDDYAQRAAAALLSAAETVSGNDDGHSADVRAQVADSLLMMVSTDLVDQQELGSAVSTLAHGLASGTRGNQGSGSTTTDSTSPNPSPPSGGSNDPQSGSSGAPSETPGDKGR